MITDEYVPFGEQWENQLMQLKKKELIQLYKRICLKLIETEEELERIKEAT